MSTDLLATLNEIAAAALEITERSKGADDSAVTIHQLTHKAIRMVAAAQAGEVCAAPSCTNVVEYSGFGRPALYCSSRCKGRAARAAKRQRER